MNNETPERLAGAVKPGNIPAGFCIPIYALGRELYIQEPEGKDGFPIFVKITEDVSSLIEYSGDQKYDFEREVLYAFLNEDGSVHYDCKIGMQTYLRSKLDNLNKYVFTKLEVLEFLEDFDSVPPIVIEAASLMLKDNPNGAIAWAKLQSEKAAIAISRSIEKKKGGIGNLAGVRRRIGRRLADGFQRLRAETLDPKEFEYCYVDVSGWQQHKDKSQALIVGRRGSGKSSFLRMTKGNDRQNDLVHIEPKFVDVVSNISSYYASINKSTAFSAERIWQGVIAGAICEKVIDSDHWPELTTNPLLSRLGKIKESLQTPDYVNAVVHTLEYKNPLVYSFIQLALTPHQTSGNYLKSEFEYIISSNLAKRDRKITLVLEGLEEMKQDRSAGESIQGITDFIIKSSSDQNNYEFIASLPSQSYSRLIDRNPNALRLAQNTFNITWNASELQQMAIRRIELFTELWTQSDLATALGQNERHALRRALLPTLYNANAQINELGLNYLIRHTQLIPRQLLYILSLLYRNTISLIDAGTAPSRNDINAALVEAAPNLVSEAVREVTDRSEEFMDVIELLISRIGPVFRFSDVARHWNNEAYLNQYFSSPVQACEQLSKVGALGRVVRRYKSYTTASFSVPLGEPFEESEAHYCFHPLFTTAVRTTERHGNTSTEQIIPVDYFDSHDAGQMH